MNNLASGWLHMATILYSREGFSAASFMSAYVVEWQPHVVEENASVMRAIHLRASKEVTRSRLRIVATRDLGCVDADPTVAPFRRAR